MNSSVLDPALSDMSRWSNRRGVECRWRKCGRGDVHFTSALHDLSAPDKMRSDQIVPARFVRPDILASKSKVLMFIVPMLS
jgi:hypothetical protein